MEARTKSTPKLRKIDVRVPVLAEPSDACDPRLLNAVDRTLLRAIDGRSTVHAIAADQGLSDEDLAPLLAKLERLGVIEFAGVDPRPTASPPHRLKSGMRPALDTIPSVPPDLSDTVRLSPAIADELVQVDIELGWEDEPADPDARLTLPGIGPRTASSSG